MNILIVKTQCLLIMPLIKLIRDRTQIFKDHKFVPHHKFPIWRHFERNILIRAREAKTSNTTTSTKKNFRNHQKEKFHLYWNFWLHLRTKQIFFFFKDIEKSLLLERKWLKWDIQQKLIWGIWDTAKIFNLFFYCSVKCFKLSCWAHCVESLMQIGSVPIHFIPTFDLFVSNWAIFDAR